MTNTALNAVERASALWQKLEAHMEDRLAALRAKVENPRLTDADRLAYCWRIDEIKRFLELGQPEPKKEMDAG